MSLYVFVRLERDSHEVREVVQRSAVGVDLVERVDHEERLTPSHERAAQTQLATANRELLLQVTSCRVVHGGAEGLVERLETLAVCELLKGSPWALDLRDPGQHRVTALSRCDDLVVHHILPAFKVWRLREDLQFDVLLLNLRVGVRGGLPPIAMPEWHSPREGGRRVRRRRS